MPTYKIPCRHPGCQQLIDNPGYCDTHKPLYTFKGIEARHPYQHLYNSSRWKKLRAAKLSETPLCELCSKENRITVANIVDHIKAHQGDLSLFYSYDNLQSLCSDHHSSKISKEMNEYKGNRIIIG
jgi:5-methylcytosine-specific restriction endonuclease McrA